MNRSDHAILKVFFESEWNLSKKNEKRGILEVLDEPPQLALLLYDFFVHSK